MTTELAVRNADATPVLAPRVLLLEDQSLLARDTITALRNLGYQDILHVRSWNDVQQALAQRDFDVALLDIDLGASSDLDGIDIGGLVQRKYGLPVVYLTAHRKQAYYTRLGAQREAMFVHRNDSPRSIDANLRIAVAGRAPGKPSPLQQQQEQTVFLKGRTGTTVRLDFADLLYIHQQNGITYVYVRDDASCSEREIPLVFDYNDGGSIPNKQVVYPPPAELPLISGTRRFSVGLQFKEVMHQINRDDLIHIRRTTAIPYHAIAARHAKYLTAHNGQRLEVARCYKPKVAKALQLVRERGA